MCSDKLEEARARLEELKSDRDTILGAATALYSLGAQKEKDWAVHGGIASGIAGAAVGVAVAADIQQENAEIRTANEQLWQSTSQMAQPMLARNINSQRIAEEDIEIWGERLEQSKLKLFEKQSQDKLLELLSPAILKTERSETGTITFAVETKGTSLKIYDTVEATVDGSFKVKIMDGDALAGEAYFTLPYDGSKYGERLKGMCTNLSQKKKDYTFVFEPHNLFVIEL